MNVLEQPQAKSPLFQWLFLGTVLLILGGIVGWNGYTDYNAIDALERDRLSHQAKVIDENLGQQLLAANQVLNSIRSDLPDFKAQKNGKTSLLHRLQALSDAMPGMRILIVLDAEGTVIASNREDLIGRNFSHREYFQATRHSGNPALLHVSPPFMTVFGDRVISLSKVIPGARGEFAGAIVTTLDPDYFATLLDSVRYAPEMWTSLAHSDGKMFLTVPKRIDSEGANLAQPGSFYARHLESGQPATVMTGIDYLTGEESMMAQRTVKLTSIAMDKAIEIDVTRNLKSIFAPWRKQAYLQGGAFLLLALLTGLGLRFYQIRQRRFENMLALHEAEKRRNIEQYQTIIQSSLDGFWITDRQARIVDVNAAVCQLLGYSREELLRMSIQDIEADESPAEVAARTQEMAETGRTQFEARHRRKDGQVIDVAVSVQYVAALGEHFFAFIRDITARKQAEAALQESESRFRKMFERNDSVMLLISPSSGAILDANAAAARFYGYPVENLKAMRIDQINTLSPEELATRRAQAVQHQSNVFIFPHRLASGEIRTVEVHSSPVEVEERVVLFSIINDITERERITAELKRSNAELEQFSYAISHDMRQPLRMIVSYMQLLEQELAGHLDHEKRDYFNFAIDGTKRLDKMLVGLLDYSRVGRKGEPPDWRESRGLLDEALLFLQPAIAEAQAEVIVQGDWPRIFVSPDEMLRLMQNLIGNAIKFRVAGRRPQITVVSATVGKQWHLSVADNGVGIIPDQIGRLFQVFQRLQSRADYEGTGIGLALCRKIAERHGGCIRAESAGTNQGSTFRVELPCNPDSHQ